MKTKSFLVGLMFAMAASHGVAQSNTTLPSINFKPSSSSVVENGGAVTVTASRETQTNLEVTVFYSISGSASNGVDYATLPGSLTIPAGAFGAAFSVQPIDDSLLEPNESVVLTLKSNANYRIGTSSGSAIVTIKDNDNLPPVVVLVKPANQSAFAAPTNILLSAEASDDVGIRQVSFYRGTSLLGTVTNTVAGHYNLTWSNASAGSYVLTAVAMDTFELRATSAPVNVVITGAALPVVSIFAPDPNASETAGTSGTVSTNTGTFTFSRTGSTNALTVYFTRSGTASNGVDYTSILETVILPQGATSTNLLIRPVNDSVIEATETVILTLRTNSAYTLGEVKTATVFIENNTNLANALPTVQLIAPPNGSVFYGPLSLQLVAQASDSDGTVTRVDFYSGDKFLGSDTTSPYSLTWSNVVPGSYTLKAKATDNAGGIRFSESSKITVKSAAELSFVKRQLPVWFVPGVKLIVTLRAEPKTNTVEYSIQDLPPLGWTVGAISNDGILDATNGMVKFHFADGLSRTLTYEVTPPSGDKGEKHFIGSATANGITNPIGGTSVIRNAPVHRADKSPTNFVLTLAEVNAYSSAWKHSERWTISPNPIPVSYVTRAGFLSANEGGYWISTNFPTPFPPLLWVKQLGIASGEPWTTISLGTATSALPTNYTPGVAFNVTITVNPAAGVRAYALEERPPEHWTVSEVNNEGIYSPVTKIIRWGLFLDNSARTFTYRVTPGTNSTGLAKFAGVVSFDGVNAPITGQRATRRGETVNEPAQLQSINTLANGDRLMTFAGQPGIAYVLEGTTNIVDWEQIEALLNNDGVIQYIDLATNPVQKFYRVVPKQ